MLLVSCNMKRSIYKSLVILFVLVTSALNVNSQSLFKIDNGAGNYGFINNSGRVVVEPQYKCVGEFSEDFAPVYFADIKKWGYIDTIGRMCIKPSFDSAYSFSEELAMVYVGDRCGYINKVGSFVIHPQFTAGGYFSNGLACVQNINGDWFFINRKAEIIIAKIRPYEFECSHEMCIEIPAFRSGMVRANCNTNSKGVYFYNTRGKRKRFPLSVGYEFSEGLISFIDIESEKVGYLNTNNKIVIEPKYLVVSNFLDGNAWVMKEVDSVKILLNINRNDSVLYMDTINDFETCRLLNVGNNTCLLFYKNHRLYLDTNGHKIEIDVYRKQQSTSCSENNVLGRDKLKWENELFAIYKNKKLLKYIDIDGNTVWRK